MKHAIPDDWDYETFCRFAICWPDSTLWRALLRGLVTEPARGFFWDENTGSIRDVLSDFRQTMDYNIELSEVFMACNDQGIADALNSIAVALSLGSTTVNCGCGGGGNASSTSYCYSGGDVNIQSYITLSNGVTFPVFGTQPEPTLPPSGFPDGYEDEAEYDADKCAKANKIVDDWITSIDRMSKVQWGAGVIGAAVILGCIVGAITVPPAVIPLLLFALTANQGISALLISLANAMQENRDELVCIMYQGETVDAIIALLADALDLIVSNIPIVGGIAEVLVTIALWLVNSDTLSALFLATAKGVYPDADCSSCLPVWWVCLIGTLVTSDENSVTVEGEYVTDFDFLSAVAYADGEDLVQLSASLTDWTQPSDHPEFSSSWDTRADACGAGLGYGWQNISSDAEEGPVSARTLQHRSNTAFTVTYTRSEA